MEDKKEPVAQEVEATETEAPAAEATQEEVKAEEVKQELIRQLKLKVDGKEEVMDLPFEVDEKGAEWLANRIQPTRAAQKRFQEAAEQKRTIEQALKNAKNDPASALKTLGVDAQQFAEQYMEQIIKEQDMTEEERRVAAAERRVAELEAQNKAREDAAIKKQQEEQYNASMTQITKQITEALESSDLPKSNTTQRRMAEYMMMNLQNGVELPMASIVELVKEDYVQDIKEMFGGASGEQLINLFGEDVTNKIRKSDLAKLKSAPTTKVDAVNTESATKKAPETINPDAFREHLEKIKG